MAYEDKFLCEEMNKEEYNKPNVDSPNSRFLRSETKTSFEMMAGSDIPKEFDWRAEYGGACRAQIEQIYDQGQCGACYAHAVTATLSDRACIAAVKSGQRNFSPLRFSANDMLTCGTRKEGKICMNKRGNQVTRYANHCDGGFLIKAMEYATTEGLKLEECDPFDLLAGDAVNPGERTLFEGQSIHCAIITTRQFEAGKVGCGRILYDLERPNYRVTLSDKTFCSCPDSDRWYEPSSGGGVRSLRWDPAKFTARMVYAGENHCVVDPIPGRTSKGVTLECTSNEAPGVSDFTIRPFENQRNLKTRSFGPISQDYKDSDGSEFSMYTKAGFLCRCPKEYQKNPAAWASVTIREQGKGALDEQCKRDSSESDQCRDRFEFNTPTKVQSNSEEAIQRAILYGGPVTATINTYGNQLSVHDDRQGKSVFMGEEEGTPTSGGHAIVLFGWGETRGTKFWLARNTWGSNWPQNAEKSGIFKIHRGQNRNEIEGGDTVFSLVSHIPPIGDLQRAFPGSQDVCKGLASEMNDALRCIEIENREAECVLKNKCQNQIVSILETTSNSVISSNSDRGTCGRIIPERLAIAPTDSESVPGVTDCCVLKASFGDSVLPNGECEDRRESRRCELKNDCTTAVSVKFKRGRTITTINGVIGSGTFTGVDLKFCDSSMEMQTFDARGRPLNVKQCFRKNRGVCRRWG